MALSIVEILRFRQRRIMSKNKDEHRCRQKFQSVSKPSNRFSDTVTVGLWTLAKFSFTDTDACIRGCNHGGIRLTDD